MLSTIQIAETKNYNFNNKFQQKERKNRMMITDIFSKFPSYLWLYNHKDFKDWNIEVNFWKKLSETLHPAVTTAMTERERERETERERERDFSVIS